MVGRRPNESTDRRAIDYNPPNINATTVRAANIGAPNSYAVPVGDAIDKRQSELASYSRTEHATVREPQTNRNAISDVP